MNIVEGVAYKSPLLLTAALFLTAATTAQTTVVQPQQAASLSASGADTPVSALCGEGKMRCDRSGQRHSIQLSDILMDELLARIGEDDDDSRRRLRQNAPSYRNRLSAHFGVDNIRNAGYAFGYRAPSRSLSEQLSRLLNTAFASGRKGGWYGGRYDRVGGGRLHRPFNGDSKRARYVFSSWGGKRSTWSARRLPTPSPSLVEETATTARARPAVGAAAFSGVGTKRKPPLAGWGATGKRVQKFFNWGGKRGSIPAADERLERMLAAAATAAAIAAAIDGGGGGSEYSVEHTVAKRDVSEASASEKGVSKAAVASAAAAAAAAAATATATDSTPRDQSRMKRLCVSDSMNLQQLFNDFVEWSRKQPEQKKATFYNKMFNVRMLHSPDSLNRRAGSFYSWGGKRNSRQKDD